MNATLDPVGTGNERDLWEAAEGLKEGWYVACTAAELKRRRLLGARILGLGIVVYRRGDGRVAALVDQCLHRGTMLSAGRLVADCLVCPYHGWRYDGDGRVVHIPSQHGRRIPDESYPYRLRAFAAREAYGLIWVYAGDRDPAATEVFAMPYWQQPPWTTYYMVSRFSGTVGALAQNFMDVPHTVHVHDTIFRKKADRLIRSTVETKPASVEVVYHDADDAIGMLPILTNPRKRPLVHTDKFFAPNITRCDYQWGEDSAFIITSQITPENSRSCRVYTLISYRFPWPTWIGRSLSPLIHAYTRIVLGQDIRIMRKNMAGLDNAPEHRNRSVAADRVHIDIERVIDAMRSGAPIAEHHLGSRSIEFYV
jgi:phenylpropionate dioxygenase-like ring-hydroxylating dioxygenase large terminal subunit